MHTQVDSGNTMGCVSQGHSYSSCCVRLYKNIVCVYVCLCSPLLAIPQYQMKSTGTGQGRHILHQVQNSFYDVDMYAVKSL